MLLELLLRNAQRRELTREAVDMRFGFCFHDILQSDLFLAKLLEFAGENVNNSLLLRLIGVDQFFATARCR